MATLTQRRRSLLLIALPLALLVALAGVPGLPGVLSGVASADPQPTVGEARRQLSRLDREVEEAVEDYNQARLDLARAQRRAAAARARVARAETALAVLQRQIGAVAASVYRSGGMDELVSLVTTSSPQTFVDQATTLDRLARGQAAQLAEMRAARRRLRAEQVLAAQAVAGQQAIEQRLARAHRDIEEKVARQQGLVGRLESAAARRARLAREAELASRLRASRQVVRTTYAGPASGRAAIAVQEAYRQLGKPYRWGAAGPDAFDCSGLTMWVWAKAGVALPHSSRAQYGQGRHVSRGELQPGDLVFFGSPIHHVGIYVGGGRYIAAPRTGEVVSVRDVSRYDYTGATRL